MDLQYSETMDICYIYSVAYMWILFDIRAKLIKKIPELNFLGSIICLQLHNISLIFQSGSLQVDSLIFGNLLSSAISEVAEQNISYYAYYCTCVLASIISCIAFSYKLSSYDEAIFSVFPIIMIICYTESVFNHGLHYGGIFPAAYIIILHIAFRKHMKTAFNRKLIIDLSMHCCSLSLPVAIFIQSSHCLHIAFFFFTADSIITILIFGHYYFLTPVLFKFYENYIISRKNLRRRSNFPTALHVKALCYLYGWLLMLFSLEIAMIYTRVYLIFVVVLIHGYSSLMLIGYAVYHEQFNALTMKNKLIYFLQAFFIIYPLRYLIFSML